MPYPRTAASRALVSLFALLWAGSGASAAEPVTVYTDEFRPFVLPAAEGEGAATRLVRMVLLEAGRTAEEARIDYAYALHAIGEGEEALSYPWRRTDERAARLTFSRPIMRLETRFHYNVRFRSDGLDEGALGEARLGRTASYAYGAAFSDILSAAEEAGRITDFQSEAEAVAALLEGEIDALPLPRRVMTATLDAFFPDEARLIRPVDGLSDPFDLHVIAPDTPWGRAEIAAFDRAFAALEAAGVVSAAYAVSDRAPSRRGDVAVLKPSEGFPVIVGETAGGADRFALPEGTRVLVLRWSDRITSPGRTDSVYATMTGTTEVLVLNGPHLGKELRVKNMHVRLAE